MSMLHQIWGAPATWNTHTHNVIQLTGKEIKIVATRAVVYYQEPVPRNSSPVHSELRNRVTQAPGPTPDPWVNLGEAQIREIVLIENEQFHDLFWDIYSFLSV